jgi:hypothetical protein
MKNDKHGILNKNVISANFDKCRKLVVLEDENIDSTGHRTKLQKKKSKLHSFSPFLSPFFFSFFFPFLLSPKNIK